jgi:hypothetical protein
LLHAILLRFKPIDKAPAALCRSESTSQQNCFLVALRRNTAAHALPPSTSHKTPASPATRWCEILARYGDAVGLSCAAFVFWAICWAPHHWFDMDSV